MDSALLADAIKGFRQNLVQQITVSEIVGKDFKANCDPSEIDIDQFSIAVSLILWPPISSAGEIDARILMKNLLTAFKLTNEPHAAYLISKLYKKGV